MSRRSRPGPFAARSRLLLFTAGILTMAALMRLPLPALPWTPGQSDAPAAAAPPAWSQLRALEPGNGPEPEVTPRPPTPNVAAAPTAPAREPGSPATLDPLTVAALQAMADELSRHRQDIDERERRVALREAVMASVEARIGEQLTRLEALKDELQRLNGQVDAEQQAKVAQMVKVYEAMKAKNAAAIFEPMALDLLLPIVRGMRETKVAAIVAEMDPAKARALTAELVRKGSAAPP